AQGAFGAQPGAGRRRGAAAARAAQPGSRWRLMYLLLGMLALALGLYALRAFTRANPADLARRLRIGGGTVALLISGLMFIRGLAPLAVPLAMFGSWLIWGRTLPPWLGGGGNARRSPGQSSRITTDHLEMELDHDTGQMHGRVRKGIFAGRSLASLSP